LLRLTRANVRQVEGRPWHDHYLEERRLYHRKDGEIVRLKDDTLAAARYGMSMRRFFKALEECGGYFPDRAGWSAGQQRRDQQQGFARGTPSHPDGDFDVFTGR
jgi:hypothetical protein